MGNFNHVLLVHHYAIRLFHKLIHFRMDRLVCFVIAHGMKSFDVCPHHARSCHAGANDGAGCHQGEIIFTAQLTQQHTHGGRFHIKASHGFAVAHEVFYSFVFREIPKPMNVYIDATVPFHMLHGFF